MLVGVCFRVLVQFLPVITGIPMQQRVVDFAHQFSIDELELWIVLGELLDLLQLLDRGGHQIVQLLSVLLRRLVHDQGCELKKEIEDQKWRHDPERAPDCSDEAAEERELIAELPILVFCD